MLTIEGNQIRAETQTLTAVFDRGVLVSLARKTDGREFVRTFAGNRAPLQLVYTGQETVPLGTEAGDTVTIVPVNEHCADVRVASWHGDGVITISENPQTGELIIEPSGYASRP